MDPIFKSHLLLCFDFKHHTVKTQGTVLEEGYLRMVKYWLNT